jgi:hypothetical protein
MAIATILRRNETTITTATEQRTAHPFDATTIPARRIAIEIETATEKGSEKRNGKERDSARRRDKTRRGIERETNDGRAIGNDQVTVLLVVLVAVVAAMIRRTIASGGRGIERRSQIENTKAEDTTDEKRLWTFLEDVFAMEGREDCNEVASIRLAMVLCLSFRFVLFILLFRPWFSYCGVRLFMQWNEYNHIFNLDNVSLFAHASVFLFLLSLLIFIKLYM